MKRLLLIAFVSVLLTSCTTTRVVEVEKIRTDTTYITTHKRDSVWLHDSIRIAEANDSVIIERWHTKYVERQVHDTTYIHKVDSIPVPYPVTKEVPTVLTWWQKTRMYAGGVSLAILGGLVAFCFFKILKKIGII